MKKIGLILLWFLWMTITCVSSPIILLSKALSKILEVSGAWLVQNGWEPTVEDFMNFI